MDTPGPPERLDTTWLSNSGECFSALRAIASALDTPGARLADEDVRAILRRHLPPRVVRFAEPSKPDPNAAPSVASLAAAMRCMSLYCAGAADVAAAQASDEGPLLDIAANLQAQFWGDGPPWPTDRAESATPDKPARRSWLYALRNNDIVKLGRSATPSIRIRDLNVALAQRGELLALVDEDVLSEKQAHDRWAALRVSGEWFRAEAELLAWLAPLGIDPEAP